MLSPDSSHMLLEMALLTNDSPLHLVENAIFTMYMALNRTPEDGG